eukprot:1681750-Alexandrium_andersonii.AAC.1
MRLGSRSWSAPWRRSPTSRSSWPRASGSGRDTRCPSRWMISWLGTTSRVTGSVRRGARPSQKASSSAAGVAGTQAKPASEARVAPAEPPLPPPFRSPRNGSAIPTSVGTSIHGAMFSRSGAEDSDGPGHSRPSAASEEPLLAG